MTIFANDIKLLKSDTMTDADAGGGSITGQVVVDGVSNNIFDDISTLDRVYGAVHMRKIFGAAVTLTNEKLYGTHMIITKLPGDQKLSVNLFNTQNWQDRRTAAQTRVENYRAQGAIYNGFLWGTQYQGSRAISIFQQERAQVPGIGDVLMIVSPTGFQYVRIQKMTNTVQVFTDEKGDFSRRILDIEITDVLQRDFNGVQIARQDNLSPEAKLFKTVVANAARYYSARPLVQAADKFDLTVKVDSVFTQVVPSAQSEIPLIDVTAGGNTATLVDASQMDFTFSKFFTPGPSSPLYLGRACLPGSFKMFLFNPIPTDDGGGLVKQNNIVIGAIDYQQGIVTFINTYNSNAWPYSFRPAVSPAVVADTASLRVTAANRGYVWAISLNPPPRPTSLSVSYRALGEWYELADNGKGGIVATESGIGTGTVNYATGSISLTLGALPDVDTDILFAWGQQADINNRSNLTVGSVKIKHTLTHSAFAPETLTISWNDGAAKTASSNAAGVISGDGTGQLNLITGVLELVPNVLPLGGTVFTVAYSYGAPVTKTISTFNTVGQNVTLNLGDTNLVPGSFKINWNAPWTANPLHTVPAGSGVIRQEDFDNGSGALSGGRSSAINYAAGTLTFTPVISATYKKADFAYGFSIPGGVGGMGASQGNSRRITGFSDATVDTGIPSSFNVTYRLVAAGSSANETFTLSQLEVDLTPGFSENIVPESILFTLGGKTYYDRSGQIFYDHDYATGAGTAGGTVNYGTGVCILSAWQAGQSPSVGLKALATTLNFNPVDYAVFKVPIAPLKPEVFQIRATPVTGGQISANADNTGRILTTSMDGAVEYNSGLVRIRFGQWVTAAGNESQPWYDPSQVFGGQIFKPKPVLIDSILFNAVGFTYLPLSSAILGLDPVRLPPDGRVPIYAPGDVLVILHDQTTTGTFSSGGTTDLGRTDLAKVTVRDSAGNQIAADKFTANLATGIITWGNLTGVSQPLTIVDRIEDMALATDVQINGDLDLSQPLTHDFPVNGTLVANAVVTQTLFAHTSVPFDQQTWSNVWSETPIGNTVVAQYNFGNYPIIVENASTITERWVCIFNSPSTVNVIGEFVGQILTGASIAGTIAPINPTTNLPYFTIPAQGWGQGWSSGNVLRFNTIGANAPVWIIQSIGQGEETSNDYKFCLEFRGDVETV